MLCASVCMAQQQFSNWNFQEYFVTADVSAQGTGEWAIKQVLKALLSKRKPLAMGFLKQMSEKIKSQSISCRRCSVLMAVC